MPIPSRKLIQFKFVYIFLSKLWLLTFPYPAPVPSPRKSNGLPWGRYGIFWNHTIIIYSKYGNITDDFYSEIKKIFRPAKPPVAADRPK